MSIRGRMNRSVEAVNDALTASGLTKREISIRTGLPYSTLIRKLSGGSELTLRDLYLLADAVGVPPAELVPPDAKETI